MPLFLILSKLKVDFFSLFYQNRVVMWADDHRPRDSVASRASTASSIMSLRENSRLLFRKRHQQTHEKSTPQKKRRTELQHVSDPAITGIVGIHKKEDAC